MIPGASPFLPFSVFSVSSHHLTGGHGDYALKSIRLHYSLKTHYRQMRRTLFRVSYAYARFFELVFSITVEGTQFFQRGPYF